MAVLSSSGAPSHAQGIVGMAACAIAVVIFGFAHWRFRTGWQMTSGRMAPRNAVRDLVLRLGYIALPGLLGTAAAGLFFAVSLTIGGDPNPVQVLAILVLGVVFVVCAIWLAKEFYYPSKRRTPEWLERERRLHGGLGW